jgi:leucyl-tRNA synthetase
LGGSTHGRSAWSSRAPDSYDHAAVEARWQAAWRERGAHATSPSDERESVFVHAGCPLASGTVNLAHLRSFAIADAHARFRRARGEAVLFSLGFDCFNQLVEQEAVRRGIARRELAGEYCTIMRSQIEQLGYSFDWDRAFLSSEPDHYQWSQRLFLAMLERDLIYPRGAQWFLRTSIYAEENERTLNALSGWSEDIIRAQREVLGRVDGVEVDAVVVGGGKLPVFTPHSDSIESAVFVAVSPGHPDIDAFTTAPEVSACVKEAQGADWWRDGNGGKRVPAVPTGLHASVPGASTLLPIVISPLFDDRLGEAAVLGIPEQDEGARAIAETLERPVAGAWKLAKVSAKPRSSVRYRIQDAPITRSAPWGVPVPVVHCEKCGTEPVVLEQLPLRAHDDLVDSPECDCPRCGGPAQLDSNTIDPRFDRMWMWMSICVPVEDRATLMFDHPDYGRWLPAQQVVHEADAGSRQLDQRTIAKMLQDAGQLPAEAREPSASAILYGSVRINGSETSSHFENVADPNELLERVGADVVRLALLNAAAPGRAFTWNDQPIRHCQRFLAELWSYAEPRLRDGRVREGGIEDSTKWRRRLVKWCRVATDKVATSIEGLEMQRATHNAILLLTRIKDFESRVATADGELDEEDRDAVVAALLILLQIFAPFVPHITQELWAIAGHDTLLAETPWPDLS